MLQACGLSDQGCVRANNEDFFLTAPEDGVFVLADGMGGARAGEHASRLAVETVASVVASSHRRDSQVLLAAVDEANRRVREAAAADPGLEGMGTTLVAALKAGPELLIASVGDSRAYLFDGTGLHAITQDQTWINDVGRPLGLDEDSLRNHPMRHVLTMAIGASKSLAINYYSIRLEPGALLLLSSDGLHGVVEPSQLESILRADPDLCLLCTRLVDAARQAGGPDNITVVLIRNGE